MAIRIDVSTQKLLQRHAERSAYARLLQSTGDDVAAGEVYDAEWLAARKELVDVFLPLVQQLARAGILSVNISLYEEIEIAEGVRVVVGGHANRAVENGNIHLYAPEVESSHKEV